MSSSPPRTAHRTLPLRLPQAGDRASPRGETAAPVKARPAALGREMSAEEAFNAVLRAGAAHLGANENGMLQGRNPEYLHQMRVAQRRLRSALGVLAPILPIARVAKLRAELKWLGASLGPARDWDVFVTETLPLIDPGFGPRSAWNRFIARCDRLRLSAGLRSRRAVRTVRYRNLMRSLAAGIALQERPAAYGHGVRAQLQPSLGDHAPAMLDWRYRRAEKKGRGLDKQSPGALHRFRIAIKNFRYAADTFSGLYGTPAARAALKRLSRLQDILGAMNDAATAAEFVDRALGAKPGRRERQARLRVLAWSRRRVAALRSELKDAWKEFRAAGKFWRAPALTSAASEANNGRRGWN